MTSYDHINQHRTEVDLNPYRSYVQPPSSWFFGARHYTWLVSDRLSWCSWSFMYRLKHCGSNYISSNATIFHTISYTHIHGSSITCDQGLQHYLWPNCSLCTRYRSSCLLFPCVSLRSFIQMVKIDDWHNTFYIIWSNLGIVDIHWYSIVIMDSLMLPNGLIDIAMWLRETSFANRQACLAC